MPNRHHHGPRNGSAGGRSEGLSRQRDAEQLRAGYSPTDWERSAWPHNTRSEPDWDPERAFARSGDRWEEDPDDGSRRYDRNELGPARGDGQGSEGEQGSLGQQLSDAGRRLLGRAERIIRNPKNYRRSDERIREDVCDRLAVSPQVDPVDLEVTVLNGEVTLAGTVPTLTMKFRAEAIADDVPGVHEVHNKLWLMRRP